MKRPFWIAGGSILLLTVFWAALLWFNYRNVGMAQAPVSEDQKLHEHDKNIPDKKVEQAFGEAQRIRDDIVEILKKKKPRFVLEHSSAPHLIYHAPGRKGQTSNALGWLMKGTKLGIKFQLGYSKEDALASFRFGLETISLGEFFEATGIGDEAVLVKNVEFNKKMTNVGLHFVKGRAKVSVYVSNHQRSREENEKELMEIVRLIEPLIIARPDFNDP